MHLLTSIKTWLWEGPLLLCIVALGLYLCVYLRGLPLFKLGRGLGLMLRPGSIRQSSQGVSALQAMLTALGGAVGTGNITGIATCVAIGGFGTLFWLWITAFLGMAIAYSETLLSLLYRSSSSHTDPSKISPSQQPRGGPMYVLHYALGWVWAARWYAVCLTFAAGGYALVQAHSVAASLQTQWQIAPWFTGTVLVCLVAPSILGGIQSIGRLASFLVPIMAIAYLACGSAVLLTNASLLPQAIMMILEDAFAPSSLVGGSLGAGLLLSMQYGAQYSIFANEAGLGSHAISGASSAADEGVEQGLLAMTGVFIATILICTMTGLVLAVTFDQVQATQPNLVGSPLAMAAFATLHPSMPGFLALCLLMFGLTTILAWSYYGSQGISYLGGAKLVTPYRILFLVVLLVGTQMELEVIWSLAHLLNGLMALPNLLSLFVLAPVVWTATQKYFGD